MGVFMYDFSVLWGFFLYIAYSYLDKCLKWCEDTNLVLQLGEKPFYGEGRHCSLGEMGHKISKSGIEVDRAKVDVIAKLPHPTTVKGVRSFLGHHRISAKKDASQDECGGPFASRNRCCHPDKKGAENLAAIIFPDLRTLIKNKLETRKSRETFPLGNSLDWLLSCCCTPWFADFANYHAGNFIVKGMSSNRKTSFSKMSNITSGMTPLVLSLYGSMDLAVCARQRSSRHTQSLPQWDPTGGHHTVQNLTAKRSLMPDSFGLQLLRCPRVVLKIATRANDKIQVLPVLISDVEHIFTMTILQRSVEQKIVPLGQTKLD
ncbi:hypothetical protein Tco_0047104 [Tanacetum coccineum]